MSVSLISKPSHNSTEFLNEPRARRVGIAALVLWCFVIIKFKLALKWAVYAPLGGLIIREIVLDAVDKALLKERGEMQERSQATATRIEDVDRKVSAIGIA